jgi:DNA-binding beta-propeller fold protein YncE
VTAVADSTVSQFTIGAGGALVPMTTPTVPTGSGPLIITLDPSGRFAYVANFYDPGATVSQYSIGANGALTPLSSPTVAIGTGRQPFGITIDPAGHFAYVEDYGNETASSTGPATVGAILQFTIGTDGSLTAAGAPVATGFGPWPVVINSTDKYAFFSNNGDNTLSECTIGAGGAFSCAASSAVIGSLPRSVSIDPSGRYLYVTSQGSGDVSQFSIGAGSSPALTPIGALGYVPVQVSPTFITTFR